MFRVSRETEFINIRKLAVFPCYSLSLHLFSSSVFPLIHLNTFKSVTVRLPIQRERCNPGINPGNGNVDVHNIEMITRWVLDSFYP